LKSKIFNLLLGETTAKPPETGTQKETQEATAPISPPSPNLPEPPVVVHVRNPSNQR